MRGCESGVVVFRVTGSPSADYWSEPVLIARAGDVPDLSSEPLPDDTTYFKIDCSDQGDTWTQIDPLTESPEGKAAA